MLFVSTPVVPEHNPIAGQALLNNDDPTDKTGHTLYLPGFMWFHHQQYGGNTENVCVRNHSTVIFDAALSYPLPNLPLQCPRYIDSLPTGSLGKL